MMAVPSFSRPGKGAVREPLESRERAVLLAPPGQPARVVVAVGVGVGWTMTSGTGQGSRKERGVGSGGAARAAVASSGQWAERLEESRYRAVIESRQSGEQRGQSAPRVGG
jgi:hypothetical protein